MKYRNDKMKKHAAGTRILTTVLLLFLGVLLVSPASARDLWETATEGKTGKKSQLPSSYGKLPQDPIQKHDLVTVLIQEQATASSEAQTQRERETEWEAELAEWIRLRSSDDNTGLQLAEALPGLSPGIDLSSEYEDEAQGQTERNLEVTGRITAEVKQVLPNGNVVLEAKKVRKVNEEREVLRVTGIARPEDISRQNTIRSERLANVFISMDGDGAVSDIQNRGILSTILDTLWPF